MVWLDDCAIITINHICGQRRSDLTRRRLWLYCTQYYDLGLIYHTQYTILLLPSLSLCETVRYCRFPSDLRPVPWRPTCWICKDLPPRQREMIETTTQRIVKLVSHTPSRHNNGESHVLCWLMLRLMCIDVWWNLLPSHRILQLQEHGQEPLKHYRSMCYIRRGWHRRHALSIHGFKHFKILHKNFQARNSRAIELKLNHNNVNLYTRYRHRTIGTSTGMI